MAAARARRHRLGATVASALSLASYVLVGLTPSARANPPITTSCSITGGTVSILLQGSEDTTIRPISGTTYWEVLKDNGSALANCDYFSAASPWNLTISVNLPPLNANDPTAIFLSYPEANEGLAPSSFQINNLEGGSVNLSGSSRGDTITAPAVTSSNTTPSNSLSAVGGAGNDNIDLSAATATMFFYVSIGGQDGNDTIVGSPAEANLLQGGNGDDVIEVRGTSATYNNSFGGLTGLNSVDSGIDTISYAFDTGDVNINLATQVVSGPLGGGIANGDDIDGFENAIGGSGNDTLTGTTGINFLTGNAGNDVLRGGRGNDDLLGGAGNDSLNGDGGSDELFGGAGDDDLYYGGGVDNLNGDVDSGGADGHGTDSCQGYADSPTGSKKYGRVTYLYCDDALVP